MVGGVRWGGMEDHTSHAHCPLPSTRSMHFMGKNKRFHKAITHKVEISYVHSHMISSLIFYPFTCDLIFLSSDSTASSH